MFFKKSKKETTAKKGIKSMDAIVTGAILGGVVASIYGVKKIHNNKGEASEHNTIDSEKKTTDKKPGIFARFFTKKKRDLGE